MTEELQQTVKDMVVEGKGILAADESTGTATKRLTSINVESTEENRRRYRELLFTAPEVDQYFCGVILFEETLNQKASDGTPFPKMLGDRGIVPGIKVDQGLADLNDQGEKFTKGLDGLGDRLKGYKKLGARFTKWRAVYTITDQLPSEEAMQRNADDLAEYARICHEEGFVPIVEPEVLMDGNHSIERCAEVTENVLKKVYESLAKKNVDLKNTILKPSMVISGKDNNDRADVDTVAKETVSILKSAVPEDVPSINFLSGGQGPEEATAHLNSMNKLSDKGAWYLSFSYGRALQETALKAWQGKDENKEEAQKQLAKRARLNSLATKGEYLEDMEHES